MRLASPRLAVPVIALVFAAAGCGGGPVTAEEVPGDPPKLTVPGTGEALAPAAPAAATATPTETPAAPAAATTTPDAGTGDSSGAAGAQGTEGGTTAAPGGQDGATTNQPPPAGSDAEQFEDFCAQNPGAC